jgi:hypothetical protein
MWMIDSPNPSWLNEEQNLQFINMILLDAIGPIVSVAGVVGVTGGLLIAALFFVSTKSKISLKRVLFSLLLFIVIVILIMRLFFYLLANS